MNTLQPEFDTCIVGKTVGPFAEQLVYSLSGLLKLCDGDREAVADLMRQAFTEHGAEAPVFCDDTLNDGGEDAEPAPPEPVPELPHIITDSRPQIIPPFPGTAMPVVCHVKN